MKRFTLFILLILGLMACKESNTVFPNGLEGKWYLKDAICYCGFGDDFNFSAHTITIDALNKVVSIQSPENARFVNKTGDYNFSLEDDLLIIDETGEYYYELNNGILSLIFVDDVRIADDELKLIYRR